LFLYSKGILDYEKSFTRTDKFDDLLESPQFETARARLGRIAQSEETSIDFTKREDNLFDKFIKIYPEWLPNSSFVVFRDHPLLVHKPHAYVERIQLSGLCYMHAPIVLQHYLVTMHSNSTVPMLDMAAYMRRFLSSRALQGRIWDDEGGVETLSSFC
jgi:hypothetical protein